MHQTTISNKLARSHKVKSSTLHILCCNKLNTHFDKQIKKINSWPSYTVLETRVIIRTCLGNTVIAQPLITILIRYNGPSSARSSIPCVVSSGSASSCAIYLGAHVLLIFLSEECLNQSKCIRTWARRQSGLYMMHGQVASQLSNGNAWSLQLLWKSNSPPQCPPSCDWSFAQKIHQQFWMQDLTAQQDKEENSWRPVGRF